MSGWIKLYRDITDHWIFTDSAYLKAWITILLTVNHEDNSIVIEKELIRCNRGQSLLSLDGWSKKFGRKWTIQRVRTFFEKLKNDNMIECEGLRKTTRLTVCKYDIYQNNQQTDNRLITDKQQADNILITTNKNNKKDKNDKKDKEEEPNKSADFIDQIIDCFIQEHGSYEILNRGKERSAAGKILNHYHKKYPDANSEETLRALRTYFASCIKIEDNWLRENMSLPTIINKFNEINNILRNGKHKGSGATDKEFASFYANQYGTDAVK